MARLWARTTTFEGTNVGDELPILVKWETVETIAQFRAMLAAGGDAESHPGGVEGQGDTDDGFVATGDQAAASQALVSYVAELLEKGFPLPAIVARGSCLSLRILAGVQPEDTISLSGWVTGKRDEGCCRVVECAVRLENQDNVLVAEAEAAIAL